MVSPDEACTNYSDLLRNYEAAHDFLWNEFGIKPRTAWQLDPFGHSAAHAQLMQELGMEQIVFSRMNLQEAEKRRKEKQMQFLWNPSFNGDDKLDGLFTHVLFDHYTPPSVIP